MDYTKPLADLIEEFRKFPSIGPRSAQRMAFTLLKKPSDQVEKFLRVIKEAKDNIKYCQHCHNLTAANVCEICNDAKRDQMTFCVVESVKDLIAIERTSEYHGLYHVLGGVISPLDGITADDLNLYSLLDRLQEKSKEELLPGDFEVILALGLNTEGEATMLYLKRLLDRLDLPVKVTRLAHGLPVGADLDYADETTLSRALMARIII